MKLTRPQTLALGYYISKVNQKTMTVTRKDGRGKAAVIIPGDWKLLSEFMEDLGLAPIKEGDYETAKHRLAEALSMAHE